MNVLEICINSPGGEEMEHTLTLASIAVLLIPMPLLIVFSLMSLLKQMIKERNENVKPSSLQTVKIGERGNVR